MKQRNISISLHCKTTSGRIFWTILVAASLANYYMFYDLKKIQLPILTTTTTRVQTKFIETFYSQNQPLLLEDAINSATGTLFMGETIRIFDGERLFVDYSDTLTTDSTKIMPKAPPIFTCDKWNVVTTIFAPSEAVKRAAKVSGWCTVIVADTKTPPDYMLKAGLEKMESVVHYLSVQDQERWLEQESGKGAVGKFLTAIPYKHFSRKNIGYLYAILHGAKILFDFDDDNLLPINNITGEVIPPYTDDVQMIDTQMVVSGPNMFNHHPLMGATVTNSWPRGFPLQYIKDNTTQGRIVSNINLNLMKSVGVLQFCANDNPDIDAIHRLVHPLPMTFTTPITMKNTKIKNLVSSIGSLVAPSHTFVPYNAQATIHTYKALWALLLPVTVPGRVSDIWRGYFAETLFRDLGLSVVFLPPAIIQDRNEHDYLADMQAELDLYFKAGKLIEFLSGWTSDAQSIPEQMEQLWIDLYERGYIDKTDVKMVQLWLAALIEINYEFPKKHHHRMDHTVLMGQFNFPSDSTTVMFWHQKWRLWFNQITIRGPFASSQRNELQHSRINVIEGRNDKGYYSPMTNLAETLQEYKDVNSVTGVLYVHDDMLLNISNIFQDFPFGTDSIVATKYQIDDSLYSVAMNRDGKFYIIADNKKKLYNADEISKKMEWPHIQKCLDGYLRLNSDPRSDVLREPDGSILCTFCKQSDVLYIPKTFANEFSTLAQLMVDNEVFLECGMPFIVGQLRKRFNANIHSIDLCTSWKYNATRGGVKMLQECELPVATVHPFKIGKSGFNIWNQAHEWSTTGNTSWSTSK